MRLLFLWQAVENAVDTNLVGLRINPFRKVLLVVGHIRGPIMNEKLKLKRGNVDEERVGRPLLKVL